MIVDSGVFASLLRGQDLPVVPDGLDIRRLTTRCPSA